ncbi:hypothetical protein [Legionella micdadei]|uniref:hypothetical protein n=1 Tax=Legionella micdadei TaxID=451 RepID=UPI0009EF7211|nr:hypothetical protein [Legionella micdadei]ARH00305.1 hypothetical protein B6V88_07665 [Legionella micdadei]
MRFCLLIITLLITPTYANNFDENKNIKHLRQSITLGKVNFSVTSKNPAAKEHFLLGTAFLHAFMYDLAISQFKQAQQLDPDFAMSYWGEALAYKHPIWNSENLTSAQNTLKRYAAHKTQYPITPKEQGYLRAAQRLFSNASLYQRDRAYMLEMKRLHQQFPSDADVASFYALSLLGIASDFPKHKESEKYIEEGRKLTEHLFKKYPNHPGVIHYYLHYHDNPNLIIAQKGLPAAKIALNLMNSSSHVTHMAAHIYRRLKLWDDYILANQASITASDNLCKTLHKYPIYACDAENKYHSLEWLHEGYLKKKRYRVASHLVKQMAKISENDPGLEYKEWYYRMWARQVLISKNWKIPMIEILPIAKPNADLYWTAYSECGALHAASFLAIHQATPIKSQLNRLDTLIRYTNGLTDPYIKQTCQIAKLEIQAEAAKQRGELKTANIYLAQAISQQKKQISTELTPSLNFLPAMLYYSNYWI